LPVLTMRKRNNSSAAREREIHRVIPRAAL
jgi:hypothetical protein